MGSGAGAGGVGGNGVGDSGVGDAARTLRQLRDELPAHADDLDGGLRRAIEATGGAVERAALGRLRPELRRAAHEIRLLGTQMTAAREDAFATVARVLGTEADALEALLRPSGDGATTADSAVATKVDGAAETNVEGAAATKAGGDAGAPAPDDPGPAPDDPGPAPDDPGPAPDDAGPAPAADLVSTAQQADVVAQHLPDGDAHRRAIDQVVARFPPKLQALARTLLRGRSAHAVQRHGHHLRREHQLARVQWRLDPAGEDDWQLNPDGSVISEGRNARPHLVGTVSGHYTSPEATAKPLIALLEAAGPTQAQLDAYLDGEAQGDTIAKVFLRPADTGITSQDVYTVRAPGSDTEPGEEMWFDARDSANDGHGDAPAVREYDQVTRGRRPGSLIILVRRPQQSWRLVTSYFADDPQRVPYTEL